NETYWQHERFNMLLKAARAELDEARRREMYAEMQLICRDEGGSVIPLFASHISAHSSRIAIPDQVAGNWEMDGFKFLERWWFA
ncbi:MAG: peptide ABC transporter substrate-binding protein, partial [Rhodospirillaceae bacterium]|nr:peptide ABC transporter substrate-binding protein [Rhodospirillaceae bacterium]